ncbi:MAG TPA: beta-propeller fold lactonase family protein [Candidatus Polarisedimenticolia bacterium]|nr:beta-propeller fold lactonase family protein [Candidatus Polarisedimenticolia bacterium]
MRRIAILVGCLAALLSLIVSGVFHASERSRRRTTAQAALAADQGLLVVYARPLPAEASRLSFRFAAIEAVREDGGPVPLAVAFPDASVKSLTRERRLASAALPAGRYSGLALRFSDVTLAGEQGRAPLQASEEPVVVAAPFTLEKRKAIVLLLGLEYRDAVATGFRFTPSFTAAPPPKPAVGLLGAASARGADSVVLFDKSAGNVAAVVPTGRGPSGLAIDSERRRLYVAEPPEDAVETIGLLEQSVLSRIPLRGGDEPVELALLPDGRTLLSANGGSSTVSVLDAVSAVETARIGVGEQPRSITVDRSGRRAYVFNEGSSTVSVLDVAARAVVATIPTEAGPFRGQLDRSGQRLFVAHRSSPSLTLIDTGTLTVTSRLYVGNGATTLKVDTASDRLYVARHGARDVQVFDPSSLLPVDAVPVDGDVSYMAIDGEGNNLTLALPGLAAIDVVRIVGKAATARVEVGGDPYAVALLGER